MYRAMLTGAAAFGMPSGWPAAGRRLRDEAHLSFLPEDVRAEVSAMLSQGRRIPEEVLGPREVKELWTLPGG